MEQTPNTGNTPEPQKQPPQLRGLYRNVHISVKALNIIIAVLAVALLVSLAFGLKNAGYTVRFDALGGTPVPEQTRMYGQLVEAPEPPTREGYAFAGWYRDADTTWPWDLAEDVVTQDMTLYAAWQPAG